MPPKQSTKVELKQQVDELTARLREAEQRLVVDVEAERDEAQERADEAERHLFELQQEVPGLNRQLEELRVERDHVVAVRDSVSGQLEGVETDLVTEKDRVRQLEQQVEDARDEVDRLQWKLESFQTEVELQVARAREQAQVDHLKELETRDDIAQREGAAAKGIERGSGVVFGERVCSEHC